MTKHLNRVRKCEIVDKSNTYDDIDLYNMSLEKIYVNKIEESLKPNDEIKPEINESSVTENIEIKNNEVKPDNVEIKPEVVQKTKKPRATKKNKNNVESNVETNDTNNTTSENNNNEETSTNSNVNLVTKELIEKIYDDIFDKQEMQGAKNIDNIIKNMVELNNNCQNYEFVKNTVDVVAKKYNLKIIPEDISYVQHNLMIVNHNLINYIHKIKIMNELSKALSSNLLFNL